MQLPELKRSQQSKTNLKNQMVFCLGNPQSDEIFTTIYLSFNFFYKITKILKKPYLELKKK